MKRPLSVLALLLIGISGCTMMPRYEKPEPPPAPATIAAAMAESTDTGSVNLAEIPWQDFFVDERLQQVIELALSSNRDLRVAALSAQKVQALYRIQGGQLTPEVGVRATGELYRLPENMTEDGRAETVEQYSVQLGTLSWELDLFGRLRSLQAGALESYLASEEARLATQISLVAGTAVSYQALAADRERLELARATLGAYESSVELVRQSHDLGVASALDLARERSQVEAARAAVAELRGLVARDRNALELLVGQPLPDELLPATLVPVTAAAALNAGLPSEVLLQRPDILSAEHQLKAANAEIGAARAAFFPRISLTAGWGTMSSSLSGLFGSGSGSWTFAPQILAPIFAGGALKANLEATQLEREIAVARYEKAIQTAFREVADVLILRETLVEQRRAQEALVRELETTLTLTEARYREGLDGSLDVLVAERSLDVARQTAILARYAEQANLITLYKALGGGGAPTAQGAAPDGPGDA